MAEKGLTTRDLEQVFKGFEKRHDEEMKILERRVVDQFHLILSGRNTDHSMDVSPVLFPREVLIVDRGQFCQTS